MAAQPAEIISSKVSVYEIEVDLGGWKEVHTHQVPKFVTEIVRLLPSLKEDPCLSGKPGGFFRELQKGTTFAHVIEHVILSLIGLATEREGYYTGWTRRLNDRHVYVIHYGAPDFLTGRLAAILSLDLVKRTIAGQPVDVAHYVRLLKEPHSYFAEGEIAGTIQKTGEPVGVIQALTVDSPESAWQPKGRFLSVEQMGVIKGMLKEIRHHLESITAAWRESFLAYGGAYGAAIIDKLELLNIDRYFISLMGGNFHKVTAEIARASQLISSYDIPIAFVIHSLWLYKNKLLASVMDKHKYQDTAPVDRFIKDFEYFYQIILHHVMEGYTGKEPSLTPPSGEFKKFIELNPRKGRILVIDDDEMIRRVVGDVLELHGYQTILAQSGVQALDLLGESREDLSLVILDVYRPDDINVKEIYGRIKSLCGNVKFIVTSGFSVPHDLDLFLSAEAISFIKKPFTVNYLMNKVESLLC